MLILTVPVSLLLGIISWSFAEYALHNWYGHKAKGRNRFSREHLKHHTNGQYFAGSLEKALVAVVAFGVTIPLSMMAVGTVHGLCYGAAFATSYLSYEWMHRRIHTHAPKTAYARWRCKHHLHHHYTRPKENHGVTSPLWDHIFGTLTPSSMVRVPERKIFEVPWLIGEDGEVKPEFADSYEIARLHQKKAKAKAEAKAREARDQETASAQAA
jgi:sterol desaturase/sphingolipid hydroxylase (fatty acid hydroxylase superfamily)